MDIKLHKCIWDYNEIVESYGTDGDPNRAMIVAYLAFTTILIAFHILCQCVDGHFMRVEILFQRKSRISSSSSARTLNSTLNGPLPTGSLSRTIERGEIYFIYGVL